MSAQKSPSRILDLDKGVAVRSAREKCFPDEGSSICPPGKSMINETEFNLVAKPIPDPVVAGELLEWLLEPPPARSEKKELPNMPPEDDELKDDSDKF